MLTLLQLLVYEEFWLCVWVLDLIHYTNPSVGFAH